MLISATIRLLDGGNCSPDKTANLYKAAPYLDLLLGVAILVIGILAVYGTIHSISTLSSGMILGVGICYVGSIVYNILVDLKKAYSPNTCTIL